MRGLSLFITQCGFSAALFSGVWAVVLRVCFLFLSNMIYLNQDLLISGVVSASSRKLISESVVGEEVKGKETLFGKQTTISFDFFSPPWTVDKYLSIIAQPVFFVRFLVCFPPNLPETRHMKIK